MSIDQLIGAFLAPQHHWLYMVLGASLLSCALIISSSHRHGHLTHDHDLEGVQKVHLSAVPRVGGLAIFVALWVGWVFACGEAKALTLFLLLASLPVFIGGLLEDLTKSISPRVRLYLAFFSATLGIILLGAKLPGLEVAQLDQFLVGSPLLLIFTVFIVGGATHSFNIIDGFNGLASGIGLLCLALIACLATYLGDQVLLELSLLMALALLGFFLFNWPLGRIFLGDAGAYLVGFWVATLLVMTVNRHPEVSVWFAASLLGYPMFETLFSIYRRRFFNKTRHNEPDSSHIHHLIHEQFKVRLQGRGCSARTINSLTAIPIWATVAAFCVPIMQHYNDAGYLMLLYLFGILFYKLSYRILLRLNAKP